MTKDLDEMTHEEITEVFKVMMFMNAFEKEERENPSVVRRARRAIEENPLHITSPSGIWVYCMNEYELGLLQAAFPGYEFFDYNFPDHVRVRTKEIIDPVEAIEIIKTVNNDYTIYVTYRWSESAKYTGLSQREIKTLFYDYMNQNNERENWLVKATDRTCKYISKSSRGYRYE